MMNCVKNKYPYYRTDHVSLFMVCLMTLLKAYNIQRGIMG